MGNIEFLALAHSIELELERAEKYNKSAVEPLAWLVERANNIWDRKGEKQ